MSTTALAPSYGADGAQPNTSDTASVVRHIAHELRQPLSTIESIAYYLNIVMTDADPRVKAQVEKLQNLVQQTNWIISDAVNFVQASPAIPQRLDLNEIVRQVVEDAAESKMADLSVELSPRICLVKIDPNQAYHLARNLLLTFKLFSKSPSQIAIATRHRGTMVRVSCSATCHGFNAYEVEEMFQPFNAHIPPGSGLALASVRRITEAHNGVLHVSSHQDDVLEVSVDFPIAD